MWVALGPQGSGHPGVNGIRRRCAPALQGALREHPGKGALRAAPDQGRDARGLRWHVAERLDHVLGHVAPVVAKQGDEVVGCLRAS